MPPANTLVRWVDENAFASIVQARPCPTLGRPVRHGISPSTTARYFSSCPSDSISRWTPCPPKLSSFGQRGITPAFGYDSPHPRVRGTSTLLIHALPSAHYGPLRLPTGAVFQVMDSLNTLSPLTDTPSGLPGSSTDLSARALLNHPGRPSRCIRSLLPRWFQASPSPAGWPPPFTCNEAESGSLSLGLTPSLSGEFLPPSPPTLSWPGPAYSPLSVTPGGRPQLLVERAINKYETFHSYRSARLVLAYRMTRMDTARLSDYPAILCGIAGRKKSPCNPCARPCRTRV